jgi:predicted helicase
LIFLTATDSTHHLREAVRDQNPPVNLISLFEMESSKVDWSSFQPQDESVELRETKTLRPHQTHAIDSVEAGFKRADRGKLIYIPQKIHKHYHTSPHTY